MEGDESMLETNIRRIVRETQAGQDLINLLKLDRADVSWLDGVELDAYRHMSANSPIVGSLTLREVRYAQQISKALKQM